MYCKHCGKQIADDSKFCQHCGGSQEDTTTTSSTEVKSDSPKQEKVVEIPTIKANFSDKTKWLIIGCGIWVVINLYWLFASPKFAQANEHFQPFSMEKDSVFGYYDIYIGYYDITEFIVYVIGLPFIIWGIVMLIKKIKKQKSNSQTTTDSTPTQARREEDNTGINNALGL